MSDALGGAVELLERALGYTRVALQGVDESAHGNLGHPTPCESWDLARLLAHMDDALDAFTDAASGLVEVHQVPEQPTRVDTLREKACALLAAWLRTPTRSVVVGGAALDAPLLVATAALEITVHGWDVAQATAQELAVPDELAAALLALAQQLVGTGDRVSRFGPARAAPGCTAEVRLLAYLGRVGHGHPESFPLRETPPGRIAS